MVVDVQLEGDFAAAYTAGDNRQVVATDTMKNPVYVLAQDAEFAAPGRVRTALAGHFLPITRRSNRRPCRSRNKPGSGSRSAGKPHPTPSSAAAAGTRTCTVTRTAFANGARPASHDLPMLKTTDSAFRGFHRDPTRRLPETDDRIFATL